MRMEWRERERAKAKLFQPRILVSELPAWMLSCEIYRLPMYVRCSPPTALGKPFAHFCLHTYRVYTQRCMYIQPRRKAYTLNTREGLERFMCAAITREYAQTDTFGALLMHLIESASRAVRCLSKCRKTETEKPVCSYTSPHTYMCICIYE